MRYFKNNETQEVFGFDETYENDLPLIELAISGDLEEITGSWPPKPQPKEITTVTMRQARLALLKKGLLDEVEAMPKTPDQQIWWEYSNSVEKYSEPTQEIAAALGLDLTELFEFAATL